MTVTRFSQASLSVPTKYRTLMAGQQALGDYELISTTVLGSAAASVTFSGLGTSAAAYKHLQIRWTGRATASGNTFDLGLRFNGDSATNYSFHGLYGDGASVASNAGVSQTYAIAGGVPGTLNAANIFGVGVTDILDWQGTKNKTVRSLAGNYGTNYKYSFLYSGAWYSTASVTSLALYPISGTNFDIGSRFSLYGLKG